MSETLEAGRAAAAAAAQPGPGPGLGLEAAAQPCAILIAALGGEGGGVLAEWIVSAAERAGLAVQSTSIPGVAQRTGATSYYIEFAPRAEGPEPVFALMPVPGRVDVLLASELLEASRMVERGFVDAERTLLISADHRVLTTAEKMPRGDGRLDTAALAAAVRRAAPRSLLLPLQPLVQQHRTAISAALFGALAGSGALPWPRALCEAVIRDGGLGVEPSLAGFGAAHALAEAAQGSGAHAAATAAAEGTAPAAPSTHAPSTHAPSVHAPSTHAPSRHAPASHAPAPLADIVARGEALLADYQDRAHAAHYRARVEDLRSAAAMAAHAADERTRPATTGLLMAAVEEAARQLALWMSYEDVSRVADLKTRRERFERVRAEAGAAPTDVLEIHEHLRPGLEELAAIAPPGLGRWLRERARRPSAHPGPAGRSLTLATTSITGFALLRLLAQARRWRRASLRYAEEEAAIERWLAALQATLPAHPATARALAELPRLRKGYGETFERGRARYEALFETWVAPGRHDDATAAGLRAAIDAALAAEDEPFGPAMSSGVSSPTAAHGSAAPAPARAGGPHVIQWHPRDSTRAAGTPATPSSPSTQGDNA